MGLDIYAGTLTRYYTHNWKTAAQRWAEEHGMGFSRVTPTGEPLAAEEETILAWSRTEGYPADGELSPGGALTMGETHLSYNVGSLAKYAFSIFYQALDFAEKNRVPVLMDY